MRDYTSAEASKEISKLMLNYGKKLNDKGKR